MERSALVELFVRPDEENVARLRRALHRVTGDLEAEVVQLAGVDVRVASPATLWRMKRDTVRAVDAEDAARRRLRAPRGGER